VPAEQLDFSFVQDQIVRKILEDYWSQTGKAFEAGSYLGTLVGCGSIVEGLLTWALLQHEAEALKSVKAKDESGQVMPLRKWYLPRLIEVSYDLKLIGQKAKLASWAVKDFRNFIHPYILLEWSGRPDLGLAESALGALREITRSLRGRLPK